MTMPRVGIPEDAAAWAAAAVAVAAFVLLPFALRTAPRRRFVIGASAVAAGALSAAYVVLYLRGGPRIVDATTYLLEARALSHGLLAWTPLDPAASVSGRFLVRDALGDGTHLAGIFPPGWPALLALGVLAGAPLAVGPFLAVLCTLATAWLAAETVRALRGAETGAGVAAAPAVDAARDVVPALAALLSAVCACLRYHTADTMSHGLAATLVAAALAAALRARVDPRLGLRLAAGGALGWLLATRPVSGAAMAMVLALILPRRPRDLVATGVAVLPGLALLAMHQRAATGAWLASSQSLYYALADGPPGCFRWGFGAGVGCEHEHGAFVAANLQGGYGAVAAVATTLRRLKAHLVDPLNLEPLLVLVVLGGLALRRTPGASVVALAPVALLVGYAPFYFDGNYPGGGARFLADALPVEHVLAALGLMSLAAPGRVLAGRRPEVVAAGVVAAALVGFAVRAGFDHAQLRDREGGRPMFERSALGPQTQAAAGTLVFVDTDHGFAIGHDPGLAPGHGMQVVRWRGDGLDWRAWETRGRPPAFRYVLSTLADGARAEVAVTPFEPARVDRIEGESLWPVAAASGASAWPSWGGDWRGVDCVVGERWLGVALAGERGVVELDLPRDLGDPGAAPRLLLHREPGVDVGADLVADGVVLASAELASTASAADCEVLSLPVAGATSEGAGPGPPRGRLGGVRLRLRIAAPGARLPPRTPVVALDAIAVKVRD